MSGTDQPYHSSTAFSLIEEKLDVSASSTSSCTIADERDEILHLIVIVGGLCNFFLSERFHCLKQEGERKDCVVQVEHEQRTSTTPTLTRLPFSEKTKAEHYQLDRVFLQTFVVARVCGIDLRTCILKKICVMFVMYHWEKL